MVSIILPSIRPQNLVKVYNALEKGCGGIDFEVIIASPYLIPEELMTKGNVVFLHCYDSPTVALQKSIGLARYPIIYHTTDDGLVLENAIKDNIEQVRYDTIVNMRYSEGVLDAVTLEPLTDVINDFAPEYWKASYHGDLQLPYIDQNWNISVQFMMARELFEDLGGVDCRFEYMTYPLLDMMFRAQKSNCKIVPSDKTVFHCSHLPCHTGDHGPVHDAQTGPDLYLFRQLYSRQQETRDNPIRDNWRQYAGVWTRRFKELKLAP